MSQAIHACNFFKNFVSRGSQGFVGQSSPNVVYVVEKPSVLNKFFFQNYNDDQEKMQVVTSLMTLKVLQV